MNRSDLLWYVPIVLIDHKHDGTMDMHRDQHQTPTSFRIALDRVPEVCHGQWSEINDAWHDDRNVLERENDASANQYCP